MLLEMLIPVCVCVCGCAHTYVRTCAWVKAAGCLPPFASQGCSMVLTAWAVCFNGRMGITTHIRLSSP